jgi:hypothetical protein
VNFHLSPEVCKNYTHIARSSLGICASVWCTKSHWCNRSHEGTGREAGAGSGAGRDPLPGPNLCLLSLRVGGEGKLALGVLLASRVLPEPRHRALFSYLKSSLHEMEAVIFQVLHE